MNTSSVYLTYVKIFQILLRLVGIHPSIILLLRRIHPSFFFVAYE